MLSSHDPGTFISFLFLHARAGWHAFASFCLSSIVGAKGVSLGTILWVEEMLQGWVFSLCPVQHRAVLPVFFHVVRGVAHLTVDGMGGGQVRVVVVFMEVLDKALSDCMQSALSRNCFLERSWGVTAVLLGIRHWGIRLQNPVAVAVTKSRYYFISWSNSHLDSCYFHILIVRFGKLFQNLRTRNLLIFSFNFFMASFVLLAVFF